jgi:TusA-related sulfurtransferase
VAQDGLKVDQKLDIRGQVCPMTFVRSKLALEKLALGEVLEILVDHRPASVNVPRSMEHEGQTVLVVEQTGPALWRICVRKDRERKR